MRKVSLGHIDDSGGGNYHDRKSSLLSLPVETGGGGFLVDLDAPTPPCHCTMHSFVPSCSSSGHHSAYLASSGSMIGLQEAASHTAYAVLNCRQPYGAGRRSASHRVDSSTYVVPASLVLIGCTMVVMGLLSYACASVAMHRHSLADQTSYRRLGFGLICCGMASVVMGIIFSLVLWYKKYTNL